MSQVNTQINLGNGSSIPLTIKSEQNALITEADARFIRMWSRVANGEALLPLEQYKEITILIHKATNEIELGVIKMS